MRMKTVQNTVEAKMAQAMQRYCADTGVSITEIPCFTLITLNLLTNRLEMLGESLSVNMTISDRRRKGQSVIRRNVMILGCREMGCYFLDTGGNVL